MNPFNITKTHEQIVIDEVVSLGEMNSRTLENLIHNFENAFWQVWSNRNATPQEIFNFFGVNALQLFQTATATIAFIQTLKPDYVPPTIPYAYAINQDGTVTVGMEI